MTPPEKAKAEQLVRVALTTTRGRIVLDLDRARKLFPAIRHEPTRGSGAMKGQMLEPVVKIIKAERVK